MLISVILQFILESIWKNVISSRIYIGLTYKLNHLAPDSNHPPLALIHFRALAHSAKLSFYLQVRPDTYLKAFLRLDK